MGRTGGSSRCSRRLSLSTEMNSKMANTLASWPSVSPSLSTTSARTASEFTTLCTYLAEAEEHYSWPQPGNMHTHYGRLRIQRCAGEEDVPDWSDQVHDVRLHGVGKPLQEAAEGHEDLPPQPGVCRPLLTTAKHSNKCWDKEGKGQRSNLCFLTPLTSEVVRQSWQEEGGEQLRSRLRHGVHNGAESVEDVPRTTLCAH